MSHLTDTATGGAGWAWPPVARVAYSVRAAFCYQVMKKVIRVARSDFGFTVLPAGVE